MSQNHKKSINWFGLLFLTLTPPAAIALTVYHVWTEGFLWPIWLMAAIFYALTAVSITAGYHRHFSHKAYEARTWLRWFWALFGAAAFQNSILVWSRDHRIHHRFVDTELDPYSINKGFWWAHFGWMLVTPPTTVAQQPYGRDLEKDFVVRFQHEHYVTIAIAMGFGLPTVLGYFLGSAMGGLAIAAFLRIVMVHHATFLINSWCHYWGKQRYTDENTARDSFIMALATFGEGYHNFHHIFANDYRNGVRWYHWDPTKWTIQFFRLLGGAHSLRRTPRSEILKAQLAMEEKRLKSCLSSQWQIQFQSQIDSLKLKVEAAHVRFEQLKQEYRELATSSMEKLEEMKFQMRLARIEFKAALHQWRAYNTFLLKAAPV